MEKLIETSRDFFLPRRTALIVLAALTLSEILALIWDLPLPFAMGLVAILGLFGSAAAALWSALETWSAPARRRRLLGIPLRR